MDRPGDNKTVSFDPQRLWFHVASFLEARSLSCLESVARPLNSFSPNQSDLLWRPLFFRDWDNRLDDDSGLSWKERYLQSQRMEHNWAHGIFQVCCNMQELEGTAKSVAIDGDTMAVGFKSGDVALYRLPSCEQFSHWTITRMEAIQCMHLEMARDLLITGSRDSTVWLSSVKQAHALRRIGHLGFESVHSVFCHGNIVFARTITGEGLFNGWKLDDGTQLFASHLRKDSITIDWNAARVYALDARQARLSQYDFTGTLRKDALLDTRTDSICFHASSSRIRSHCGTQKLASASACLSRRHSAQALEQDITFNCEAIR